MFQNIHNGNYEFMTYRPASRIWRDTAFLTRQPIAYCETKHLQIGGKTIAMYRGIIIGEGPYFRTGNFYSEILFQNKSRDYFIIQYMFYFAKSTLKYGATGKLHRGAIKWFIEIRVLGGHAYFTPPGKYG